MRENNDMYNYTQGGIVENLRYENGLQKSHIDELLIKLKEKEIVNSEMEEEILQANETIALLSRKLKTTEDQLEDTKMDYRKLKEKYKKQ